MIDVLDPGALTTVQDRGRPGWNHLGISPGGAADPVAYDLANRLVANQKGAAVLEMTLKGGRFLLVENTVFAITGADFGPTLAGTPVPCWQTVQGKAGQELHFGIAHGGARCYLAVAGGFLDELILGSRSALVSAGLGHRLQKGDRLICARSEDAKTRVVAKPPEYDLELSVIPGPYWTRKVVAEFTVSDHANRHGIRIDGPQICPPKAGEAASEGVTWGTIQAPGAGQLLILMNEQQTTGGYPVVGYVQAADHFRLAQLRPRDLVVLRETTSEKALRALRKQADYLAHGVTTR